MLLSSYPESVVVRVTDPRTGLPGRQQFLPTIKEVRDACEAEMAPLRREIERERRAAFVLEDQRRDADVPADRRKLIADGLRAAAKTAEDRERDVAPLDARRLKPSDPRRDAVVRQNEHEIAKAQKAIASSGGLKLSESALAILAKGSIGAG